MANQIVTTGSSASVMERLKAETADRHKAAEGREFQRRLVRGEVNVEDYSRWLAQMLLVHRALEVRLRSAAAVDSRINTVVTSEQYQVPYLVADLAHFNVDASVIRPDAGTQSLIGRIDRASGLEILGMHYVLEGSNNGNRFIAKAVRKALALVPGSGDRYLDPYGDSQRDKWASFKVAMDAVPWTQAEADAIVGAAKDMFDGISAISDDLAAPAPVAP